MKLLLTLFLLQISTVASVIHSLKYQYTLSTQVGNLPEFVAVYLVDGVQIIHYDSKTKRAVPKQDWINKVTEDHPKFWDEESEILRLNQQNSIINTATAKQRFNQDGGLHVVQVMYGCEWDDDTNQVKGFERYGYDGEDFLFLDLKTETWTAMRPQADFTKHKLDKNKGYMEYLKEYYRQECPDWLKKFLNYGKSSLMRKDLPSVSLLQKTPSSPVTCHATGFYPDKADLFWTNDGVELHENVVRGKILPNHDGTFQTRVDLDLKEVKEEDWWRYRCVFQLSGVHEVITPLDKHVVMLPPLPEKGFPLEYVFFISFGIFCLFFVLGYFTVPYIQKRNRLGFGRVNAHGSSLSSER
ncbi:unnamed protein product [Ophioblennius macclurei]